jgi:hypothetical protein
MFLMTHLVNKALPLNTVLVVNLLMKIKMLSSTLLKHLLRTPHKFSIKSAAN